MAEKHRFLVDAPPDLMEWIDQEAANRDRSRAWMVCEILRQYRNRLTKTRSRKLRDRNQKAGQALRQLGKKGTDKP
jgi:predicted transcriptional regulator